MEWWLILTIFFGALITLMFFRVPVAFALLGVNLALAAWLFGWEAGLRRVVVSMFGNVTTFVLVPVPLFILMGELLLRSGVANRAIETLDGLLGRIPGRLPVLATASGALFGILSGSTLANTAVLGKTLLPRMIGAGYSSRLSMGSILASGGLAMIIPPSALAVIWGAIAGVPVGALLVAGIIPGFLMAANYVVVIVLWSILRGNDPPVTAGSRLTLAGKITTLVTRVAPLGTIVIVVVGLIFFGVATPSESAAVGVLASVVLVAAYREFNWRLLWESLLSTARITAMLFFIVIASGAYSQLMAFSGATSGMVNWLVELPLGAIGTLIVMQIGLLFLGLFLEQVSIMLVTLPFFMPVVHAFGWDPVWFGIVMLINLQIAGITPPFGLGLFVMKGVAPPDTPLLDVYAGASPFVFADLAAIALLVAVPGIALWLPTLMA